MGKEQPLNAIELFIFLHSNYSCRLIRLIRLIILKSKIERMDGIGWDRIGMVIIGRR